MTAKSPTPPAFTPTLAATDPRGAAAKHPESGAPVPDVLPERLAAIAADAISDALRRCTDFVFPPAMPVVTKALLRATVYAKHGPAYWDGSHLRLASGGPPAGAVGRPTAKAASTAGAADRSRSARQPTSAGSGTSVQFPQIERYVQHFEEKVLLDVESHAFLLDAYGGTLSKGAVEGTELPVPDEVSRDMGCGKDPLFYDAMEVSRAELKDVLDAIPMSRILLRVFRTVVVPQLQRDGGGGGRVFPSAGLSTARDISRLADEVRVLPNSMLYAIDTSISNALLELRRRRLASIKTSTPQLKNVRSDLSVTDRLATQIYNKVTPKAYKLRSWADPRDVLRALHRSATAITEYEERHNPAVNLNVRCLRSDFVPDPSRPGWDPCAALRKSHSGKNPLLTR